MIKSIVSALSFYAALSSGDSTRRLLQAQFPAVEPPAPAPAAQAPAPGAGAGVQPVGPAMPVTPQTAPPNSIIPIIPPPASPGSGTPLSLVCDLTCTDTANCPSGCAQQRRTIQNAGNSFTMECSARGSCAASQYSFVYSGGMTRYMDSIQVSAPYALYGSTIEIDNSARGGGLTVRTIDCGMQNCAGATFRFLNADYGDITCEEYNGCGAGCMVEMPPDAPISCDLVSTV